MSYAYTRPRYQVSVYRTIGPMVPLVIPPVYKVYRGYIVFVFPCVCVCVIIFFSSKISQQLLDLIF